MDGHVGGEAQGGSGGGETVADPAAPAPAAAVPAVEGSGAGGEATADTDSTSPFWGGQDAGNASAAGTAPAPEEAASEDPPSARSRTAPAPRQRSPLQPGSTSAAEAVEGRCAGEASSPAASQQHVYIQQPPTPPPSRDIPPPSALGSSVGSASGLTDELARLTPPSGAPSDAEPGLMLASALPCPVHGFSAELCVLHFCCVRHSRWPGGPRQQAELVSKWRQKDRLKTSSVALVLCLNIGVDPPDVIKITPCARLECWVDPLVMQSQKALETIGKNLQAQYERWQPRAKYKTQLDPTVDDLKKLCVTSRRTAKGERMLFHYNGHGVPRPTVNGEIWVFNKNYTQYIPLSVYDLQAWVGTPAIYVFDCSAAGLVVNTFKMLLDQHPSAPADGAGYENGDASGSGSNAAKEIILLAACGSTELLPQSPELPADVFTACLTTPIKVALRWFCSRSLLRNEGFTKDQIDRIPGKQTDRKTLLGELNWIFTAITDTIAWNVLPRSLFQKLFRQDLLVASLFRNFLLAERIMRAANCSPVSFPPLPPTHQHPMWQAWDMAAERCLAQLPHLLNNPSAEFQPSSFFSEQLTAFEIWLQHGSKDKRPPEQLPIVLQVLLSQVHRMRALLLLGRFVDMGSWAVDLALSVGIFPYVLKLLQTTATDLRQILVFIWTKILALDKSCQVDLVKDNGHLYFIKFLDSSDPTITSSSRAMAAFVLAVICDHHAKGQMLCANSGLLGVCLSLLPPAASASSTARQSPILLKWLLLCLGKLCENMPEIAAMALQDSAAQTIAPMLTVDDPEVRAAAVYALSSLIMVPSAGHPPRQGVMPEAERLPAERVICCYLIKVVYDGSPLVRAEVAVGLARIVAAHYVMVNDELMNQVRSSAKALRTASFRLDAAGHSLCHSSASSDAGSASRPGSQGAEGGMLGGGGSSQRISPSGSDPPGGHGAADSPDGAPISSSLGIWVAPAGGAPPSSSLLDEPGPAGIGGWASADAARVGGGIYEHLCQAIYLLAVDPKPQVASVGRATLAVANVQLSAVAVAEPAPSGGLSSASGSLHGGNAAARSMGLFRRSMGFGSAPPPATSPSDKAALEKGPSSYYVLHRMRGPASRSPSADPTAARPSADAERGAMPNLAEPLPGSVIYPLAADALSSPLLPPGGGDIAYGEISVPKAQVDLSRLTAHYAHSPAARQKQRNHCRAGAQGSLKLRETIVTFETDSEGTVALHLSPFEPLLTSVDYHGTARVYSCAAASPSARPVNSFQLAPGEVPAASDAHPPPGPATSGDLPAVPATIDVSHTFHLNELHGAGLLGVGALDGSVRVWRAHTRRGHQSMVAAWQAVPRPPVLEGHQGGSCGAVFEYSGPTGVLAAAGGAGGRCLWLWDLAREACVAAVGLDPWGARPGTGWADVAAVGLGGRVVGGVVERLAAARDEPLLAAGCADGSVQLLDLRCPTRPVAGLRGVRPAGTRLAGLAMGLGGDGRQLATACTGGSLKLWDIRGAGGPASGGGGPGALVRALEAHSPSSGLTCMAAHPSAPLLATGTKTHTVKVWNAYGDLVGAIRAAGGYLGTGKGGAITSLAFHPLQLKLVAGGDTPVIALYTIDAPLARVTH